MKALVVRLSSIGDVVHTLPVLAALRRHGWEAGWLVEPPSRPLLDHNPALAQVVTVPSRRAFAWGAALRAVLSLRGGRYDVALEFQGLWKSAAWARVAGARRVVGWDRDERREPASAVLLDEGLAREGRGHVIDRNLELLRAIGIEAVGLREFPLPFDPHAVERVDRGLAGVSDPVAILNPGGGWPSKLWPAERFGQLAKGLRGLGLVPLVTWGPGEQGLADRVVAASGGAARRAFETTLSDYVELARRARLVVAADTGPMHLACAVGTPVVALFGPTDPERNGPFAAEDVVVREIPPCAPCYSRSCAWHQRVMEDIEADAVLAAAARRLEVAREQDHHAL